MDIDEYRTRLEEIELRLSWIYRERRELTEAFADEHPPVLPPPRYQSDRQQRIARCPRCGGSLKDPV